MNDVRKDIETSKYVEESSEIYPETEMLKKRLEWFQDLKFGVIFHYGLYAQAGILESWQLSEKDTWAREGNPYRETIEELQIDYWNLIRTFNPVDLDATKWVDLCRRAGFKYCIFTTKHHDGFNMYNTTETEYKIGGKLSPFKRDIVKEIFTAFQQADIAIGAYYSKADWFSPFYWLDDATIKGRTASYNPLEHPEIWARYVSFVHHQIEEITSNYGSIDLLWLDAGWCGRGKEDLQMDQLAELARKNQPELIIVDRMMGGRHENYVTPERKIPELHEIPTKVWESNIPIGNDWGYVPHDIFKSSQELIENLIDVVSKGGNLILGVGPTPKGAITKEETEILEEIGTWLTIYGEGIYETRAQIKESETDWRFTYQKNGKIHYAFRSIRQESTIFVPLVDIKADEQSTIKDLATNEILTIYNENGKACISLNEVTYPKHGAIGLRITKGEKIRLKTHSKGGG